MRLLCIMLAVMLLLVLTAVLLSSYLFSKITVLREDVAAVTAAVEQRTRQEAMEKLAADWNRWREIFSLFIPHEEIDTVTRAVSRLNFTVKERDGEELEEAAEDLFFAIEGLRREELASLPNVL